MNNLNLFSVRKTVRNTLGDNPDEIATIRCLESLQSQKFKKLPDITLSISILLSYWLKSVNALKREIPTARQPEKQIDRNPKSKFLPGIWLLSILLTFWLSPRISGYKSDLTSSSDVAIKSSQYNLDNALPVETTTIGAIAQQKVWRSYTGTLAARRQSSLSLQRLGKVTQISVDEGDRVTAGTPLATLDTNKLLAKKQELLARRQQLVARLNDLEAGSRSEKIAVARLSLENAQDRLELARMKQQRRQQLYNSGAISLELLNEATTQARSDRTRVEQAQNKLNELLAGARPQTIAAQQAAVTQLDASLASLNVDLSQSVLKAPFSGAIAKRLVDEGMVVNSGQPILDLVETDLEARIGVPLDVAERLTPGSDRQLQIGSKTYRAKVRSILPQLDPSSRTVTIILGLENTLNAELRSGEIAKLKVAETIADSGYWLPTTALARGKRGLWTCYALGKKITENGKTAFAVQRRDLEVLHTEGDRILVRGTLQESDRIITSGTHRLVPDLLVQPN